MSVTNKRLFNGKTALRFCIFDKKKIRKHHWRLNDYLSYKDGYIVDTLDNMVSMDIFLENKEEVWEFYEPIKEYNFSQLMANLKEGEKAIVENSPSYNELYMHNGSLYCRHKDINIPDRLLIGKTLINSTFFVKTTSE